MEHNMNANDAAEAIVTNEWFYEKNGERIGAISQQKMIEMVRSGELQGDSSVWRQGFTDWVLLESTELKNYLDRSVPPPLTGQHINNTVVWVLAFAPIIGTVLEYFVAMIMSNGDEMLAAYKIENGYYFVITIALNIMLSVMDANRLEKAGVSTDKFKGMVWLVPVYLFKRAKFLNHNLAYFIVWIVCFIITMF